jgi:hypothetical protein
MFPLIVSQQYILYQLTSYQEFVYTNTLSTKNLVFLRYYAKILSTGLIFFYSKQ